MTNSVQAVSTFNAYADPNGNLSADRFRDALNSIDPANAGRLNSASFATAAGALGLSKEETAQAFKAYDADGDGVVDTNAVVSSAAGKAGDDGLWNSAEFLSFLPNGREPAAAPAQQPVAAPQTTPAPQPVAAPQTTPPVAPQGAAASPSAAQQGQAGQADATVPLRTKDAKVDAPPANQMATANELQMQALTSKMDNGLTDMLSAVMQMPGFALAQVAVSVFNLDPADSTRPASQTGLGTGVSRYKEGEVSVLGVDNYDTVSLNKAAIGSTYRWDGTVTTINTATGQTYDKTQTTFSNPDKAESLLSDTMFELEPNHVGDPNEKFHGVLAGKFLIEYGTAKGLQTGGDYAGLNKTTISTQLVNAMAGAGFSAEATSPLDPNKKIGFEVSFLLEGAAREHKVMSAFGVVNDPVNGIYGASIGMETRNRLASVTTTTNLGFDLGFVSNKTSFQTFKPYGNLLGSGGTASIAWNDRTGTLTYQATAGYRANPTALFGLNTDISGELQVPSLAGGVDWIKGQLASIAEKGITPNPVLPSGIDTGTGSSDTTSGDSGEITVADPQSFTASAQTHLATWEAFRASEPSLDPLTAGERQTFINVFVANMASSGGNTLKANAIAMDTVRPTAFPTAIPGEGAATPTRDAMGLMGEADSNLRQIGQKPQSFGLSRPLTEEQKAVYREVYKAGVAEGASNATAAATSLRIVTNSTALKNIVANKDEVLSGRVSIADGAAGAGKGGAAATSRAPVDVAVIGANNARLAENLPVLDKNQSNDFKLVYNQLIKEKVPEAEARTLAADLLKPGRKTELEYLRSNAGAIADGRSTINSALGDQKTLAGFDAERAQNNLPVLSSTEQDFYRTASTQLTTTGDARTKDQTVIKDLFVNPLNQKTLATMIERQSSLPGQLKARPLSDVVLDVQLEKFNITDIKNFVDADLGLAKAAGDKNTELVLTTFKSTVLAAFEEAGATASTIPLANAKAISELGKGAGQTFSQLMTRMGRGDLAPLGALGEDLGKAYVAFYSGKDGGLDSVTLAGRGLESTGDLVYAMGVQNKDIGLQASGTLIKASGSLFLGSLGALGLKDDKTPWTSAFGGGISFTGGVVKAVGMLNGDAALGKTGDLIINAGKNNLASSIVSLFEGKTTLGDQFQMGNFLLGAAGTLIGGDTGQLLNGVAGIGNTFYQGWRTYDNANKAQMAANAVHGAHNPALADASYNALGLTAVLQIAKLAGVDIPPPLSQMAQDAAAYFGTTSGAATAAFDAYARGFASFLVDTFGSGAYTQAGNLILSQGGGEAAAQAAINAARTQAIDSMTSTVAPYLQNIRIGAGYAMGVYSAGSALVDIFENGLTSENGIQLGTAAVSIAATAIGNSVATAAASGASVGAGAALAGPALIGFVAAVGLLQYTTRKESWGKLTLEMPYQLSSDPAKFVWPSSTHAAGSNVSNTGMMLNPDNTAINYSAANAAITAESDFGIKYLRLTNLNLSQDPNANNETRLASNLAFAQQYKPLIAATVKLDGKVADMLNKADIANGQGVDGVHGQTVHSVLTRRDGTGDEYYASDSYAALAGQPTYPAVYRHSDWAPIEDFNKQFVSDLNNEYALLSKNIGNSGTKAGIAYNLITSSFRNKAAPVPGVDMAIAEYVTNYPDLLNIAPNDIARIWEGIPGGSVDAVGKAFVEKGYALLGIPAPTSLPKSVLV